MASENIYVFPSTCDNIFVINPNKVTNEYGNAEDRNIKQENLIYYANLECDLEPRSRLISGADKTTVTTVSLASMNFLNPTGAGVLTTEWTGIQDRTANQNQIGSQLLGMKGISYRVGLSYIPTITVNLEDVKGRALFESGENSPYSAFFNLPYPTFYLTIKGYYGKAVRYPLILQKFTSSFNSSTGNFDITLTMIGYKFNVLTDITMAELFAVPQMYLKRTNVPQGENTGNQTQTNTQQITQIGYQKIQEVYKDYKNLKLIPEDFPELTVQQLSTKLDNFINYNLAKFGQSNLTPLNDIDTYSKDLSQYRGEIYNFTSSWFNSNLDPTNFFISNPINNVRYKIYTYKLSNFQKLNTVVIKDIDSQYSKLQSIITQNNTNLKNNTTFGSGEYKIENPIGIENVKTDDTNIDYVETYKQRNNVQTVNQQQVTSIVDEVNNLKNLFNESEIGFLFQFDGPSRFLDLTYELDKILNDKKSLIEDKLTKELSSFIQTTSGLGFAPTLRNIIAVIMASAEAFLRLMQDVHKKAFDVRNSEIKKLVTKNDSASQLSPVYPWPQFVVEKNIDGQVKFEIQYPGDNSVISITKGNNYTIWPEVEFVEEFLKGYLQREVPPIAPIPTNEGINRILISGFETLPSNQPYSNLTESKFLYEVWERIQTITQYNGFQKNNTNDTNQNILNFLSETESLNAYNGLNSGNKENSPRLNFIFKNSNFTKDSFFSELVNLQQDYSIYSQGYFVTDYLNKDVNVSPNKILFEDLPVVQITNDKEKNMENYLNSNVHNDISFTDTYPYTDSNWCYKNLAAGQDNSKFKNINSTQLSIYYNKYFKKITNFDESSVVGTNGNKTKLRPYTDYNWKNNEISLPVDLESFYKNRKSTEFVPTEGYLNYTDSAFTNKQTTSILNTPYFINAIQKGIDDYSNGESSPYKEASFLFLNSLPLSTLKERYLSFENNLNTYSDFIFSGLKKFGAVHKLPYFWILKIGSNWNRYKNYVNNDSDYIESIWTDFDYLNNFDPINGLASTTYVLSSETFNTTSITIENTQTSSINYHIGFYPKLINDFYLLHNGSYLYNPNSVTNSLDIQNALQKALNEKKIIVFNTNQSNIQSTNINLITWTVLIKVSNSQGEEAYTICPSFGTTTNQIQKECFANNSNIISLSNNPSIHNGSVRLFWGAPNYGYFNTIPIRKPSYNEYLKKVYSDKKEQVSFELFNNLTIDVKYSNIEEIFSVFDTEELNNFEIEFLKFASKGSSSVYSFESIFKKITFYNEKSENIIFSGADYNEIVKSISTSQSYDVSTTITNSLQYDVLIKRGNPTGFDKNLFNILSSNPSPSIVNRYNIQLYSTTPNSVPTNFGITYSESKDAYPNEWKAMELYVGFSTIDGLNYNASENYLTNFFRVFNIGFTVDNIKLFRNLIKMYGTTSILGGSGNIDVFKNKLDTYLSRTNNLSGETFTNFITSLQKKLGGTDRNTDKIDSIIDGFQSKVELYDMFKAINDKWIAGNDYTNVSENSDAPLFKDYLFIDRANRNVGDIFVDITKVNSYLKGANVKSNVFTVVGSIIKDHNFVSFLMPSYINFYGRQTPTGDDTTSKNTGPNEFANNLFGTFDTVDYQSSKPKMLNIYVDKPSQQTDNKSKLNGYKDDGLDITICAENSVGVDASQKRNFSLENRIVGFAVDFELQNQGVFKKINVSQDLGKATSESLMAEYNLAQSSSGVKTSTQSVSLYNIYKTRSYAASVETLGNVMIQPSMYFVLRNIPLFAGSYFITEVNHSIGLDDFSTSFTGTRQAVATLPKVDTLFQTIKQQLLTSLSSTFKNQGNSTTGIPNNSVQIKNSITNSIIGNKINSLTPNCDKDEAYSNYVKYSGLSKNEGADVIVSAIKVLPTTDKVRLCIFISCWIESGLSIDDTTNRLQFFGNNIAGVTLNYDYPGELKNYFETNFMCLTNTSQYTQSYAVFDRERSLYDFMIAAYPDYINNTVNNITDKDTFATEFSQFWIGYFPYNKVANTPTIFNDYVQTNNENYQKLLSKIKKGFDIYQSIIPTT
jgi:hypothetical protein